MRLKIIFILICLLYAQINLGANSYIDPISPQERSFPYFTQGDFAQNRQLVEAIMATYYQNMTVPVTEDGKLINVNFFKYVENKAKQFGINDLEFYPSGGLNRNLIGKIYSQVEKIILVHPTVSVSKALEEIKSQIPKTISNSEIRGIGSDLDIFFTSKNPGQVKKLNEELKQNIRGFDDNSQLNTLDRNSSMSKLRRTLVVDPDFKDPIEQTLYATAQGGLESDNLVFDIKNKKLKDPYSFYSLIPEADRKEFAYLKDYDGAVDRVLMGRPRYQPEKVDNPLAIQARKNGAQTDVRAVRALRTLSEHTFSVIDDYTGNLSKAFQEINSNPSRISLKAQEQIGKMLRNSRDTGNSLIRNGQSSDTVAKEISQFLSNNNSMKYFLIEADPEVIKKRQSLLNLNQELENAMIPVPEKLNHGTSAENIPSMDRGFIISTASDFVNTNTNAAFGSGFYTTTELNIARSYAGEMGVIIPLETKENIRALDWGKLPSDLRNQIITEAQKLKVDKNIYLFEKYGIQVI